MKLSRWSDEELELSGNPKLMRFAESYLLMSKIAKYRPMAPGDGCGNISLSQRELTDPKRLKTEAKEYSFAFDKEEDERCFWIGCSNFSTNRAFIWAIEAARNMAAGSDGNTVALTLLKMAVAELEYVRKSGEN